MEEKEILLKTIEGLNASIASLSTTNKNQSEQIKNLQERIKELTAQVAWLNRQLFGRKSEKLRVYDPNMPDLFADEFSGLRQQAEEKRDEAVEKIEKESVEDVKRNRQNRKMIDSQRIRGSLNHFIRVGIVERKVTPVLSLFQSAGNGKTVETPILLTFSES